MQTHPISGRFVGWFYPVLITISLSACQTPPPKATQDFVAAANALAQAESDYFDQIQAASDASHMLLAGAIYVGHGGDFNSIRQELNRRDDFSKAKKLRLAVLSQLQNYAQQLEAITTAAGGSWVADDAKATTTDVTKLLGDLKAAKITSQQAGIVQTAVNDLAQAIINNMTARELQKLSQEASKPIADIADFIAKDNGLIEETNFAPGLSADQETALMSMLNFVYTDRSVNAAQRYAVLMEWKDWKPALVTKGADIASALKKLQQANDALAADQEASANVLAGQAFQFAEQALGVSTPGK